MKRRRGAVRLSVAKRDGVWKWQCSLVTLYGQGKMSHEPDALWRGNYEKPGPAADAARLHAALWHVVTG